MRKNLAIFLFVLVGLVIISAIVFVGGKTKGGLPARATPTPTPEKVVETPLEERPFVTLIPRSDGRELTLEIKGIKNTTSVEYELAYLSNDLSRGVIGSIELKGEDSLSRKLLLGSCSRNVCKYDENVSRGTLTLRLRGPGSTKKFTADFHLQRGDKELTSINGKFRFTGKISPSVYYLTMSTIGLPSSIEGKVIAGPYGVFTAGSGLVKGKVSFEGLGESAKTYAWTGKQWQELANAESSQLTIFVAVSPE